MKYPQIKIAKALGEARQYSPQARWVRATTQAENEWHFLRKTFTLPASVKKAALLITARSYAEIYLNGFFIGRHAIRSFNFDKYYDVLDVSPFLVEGKNAITLLVTDGRDARLNEALCEIQIECTDGCLHTVTGGEGWKTRLYDALPPTCNFFISNLRWEEWFDARRDILGVTEANFEDSGWAEATVLGPVNMPPYTKVSQTRLKIQTHDPAYPVGFAAIEFSRDLSGYSFRLGPTGDCTLLYMTQIKASEDCAIRLHSSAEFATLDGVKLDRPAFHPLTAGTHKLCIYSFSYHPPKSELLIETEGRLEFSSVLFADAQWLRVPLPGQPICYPWNGPHPVNALSSRAKELLEAPSFEALSSMALEGASPAENEPTTMNFDIQTRRYCLPRGGYTDPRIDRPQPRIRLEEELDNLFHREALLSDNPRPAVIAPLSNGNRLHFVLDFGIEQMGMIDLELDAPEGTLLEIQGFEAISEKGIAYIGEKNSLRYLCREGRQQYLSHCRRGYRYLSVTLSGHNRPVLLYRLRTLQMRYPAEEGEGFECSDQLVNTAYRLSIDTAKLCMQESYVDCPGFEQAIWVGDARVTALINLNNFGEWDFDQHFLRLVGKSLDKQWVEKYWPGDKRYESGRFMTIAVFPDYPEIGLPLWTFQWMLHIYEHYLYGGSLEDLAENFEYLQQIIHNCRHLTNERHLLDIPEAWNLIEWANNDLPAYGEVTANNLWMTAGIRRAAEIAGILGKAELQAEYSALADRYAQAINRYCWDESLRAYVDTVRDEFAYERYVTFSQSKGWEVLPYEEYLKLGRISVQTNTLALLSGIAPADRQEDIARFVIDNVDTGRYVNGSPVKRSFGAPTEAEAPGGVVAIGSPFFLFFAFEALYKIGRPDLVLKSIRRDWYDMVASGVNTCWENFKQGDRFPRSMAHSWSASPAIYLKSEVLGVKPVKPGFTEFSVHPQAAGLEWAKGSVPTPYGPIYVSWRRRPDRSIEIKCTAPKECRRVE